MKRHNPLTELLSHPQPVNKMAALHTAGGSLDRESLLWAQQAELERVLTEVRLANMAEDQRRRLELERYRNCSPLSTTRRQGSQRGQSKKLEEVIRKVQNGAKPDDLDAQARKLVYQPNWRY